MLEKSQYTELIIVLWHHDWFIFSLIFCSLLANESKKNKDKSMNRCVFGFRQAEAKPAAAKK